MNKDTFFHLLNITKYFASNISFYVFLPYTKYFCTFKFSTNKFPFPIQQQKYLISIFQS